MPWEMKVVATLVIHFTFVSVSSGNNHTRTPIPQCKITWKLKRHCHDFGQIVYFFIIIYNALEMHF